MCFRECGYIVVIGRLKDVLINVIDMFRKELLNDEMTFTKWGWIYQYNSIPNNREDKLTYHWMKKTYEHLYD